MPGRLARLPGPVLFFHHLHNGAFQIDEILAGDLNIGVTQTLNRSLRAHHAGVVQHQHIDAHPANALVVTGRRVPDMGQLGPH